MFIICAKYIHNKVNKETMHLLVQNIAFELSL